MGGMGAGGVTEEESIPVAVKETYRPWWWALCFIFILVAVGRCVATDPFGGMMTFLLAYIIYFMVRRDCANMTQYCLFMFGLMVTMNAVFETIAMLSVLGGRTMQTNTMQTPGGASSGSKTTSYTVTIETHAFFDGTQDFVYNAQSFMMIASPVSLILASALAHQTYNACPSSLFDQDDAGAGRQEAWGGGMGGGQQYGAGSAGPWGGGAGGGGGQGYNQPGRSSTPQIFGGQGQRLGG